MSVKWILLAVLVAGMVFLGLGIRPGQCPLSPTRTAPPEIEIGALLPLSGDTAPYGQNARNAIDLAVEQIIG